MTQIDPLGRGAEAATFLPPTGAIAAPVGFVGSAIFQSAQPPEVKAKMAEIAAELSRDPVAMQLFCDRVYQLLHDDIQQQQDRSHSYGKR